MAWNWQVPGWPDFRYDDAKLASLEQRFLLSSGEILGAVHHVRPPERDQLRIDLLSDEAMKTGPPPQKWSSAMFRKTEETHGQQATEAGRDCHEVAAG